jgi:hypothetical protein
MRVQVGDDIIEVPDGLDESQVDEIVQRHVRSKSLDTMREGARQEMAALDPFSRGYYGVAHTIAEPIVGLGQLARQALGRDTSRVEEQIAQMRGAREGAGTAGTVGEVATFAAPGVATERVVAAAAPRLARALARFAPRAVERAVPAAARLTAGAGAEAAVQGGYEASRGTLADDPSRGERAAQGALWGAGGAVAGDAVGAGLRATLEKLRPGQRAQELIDWAAEHGVDLRLTLGQAKGRGSLAAQVEDALKVVPGVKQLIERRQSGAVADWNAAQLNAAVANLMPTDRAISEAGSQGIAEAQRLVDDAYRRSVEGVTLAVPPNVNPFLRTQRMITDLPPQEAEIVQKALDVTLEAARSGQVSGDGIIGLRSRLDKLASQYYRTGSYTVGEALDQLDDDFRALSGHFMSPAQRELLQEANESYRRLKPINRAASLKDAVQRDNMFTPSQLVYGVSHGMPESVRARGGSPQMREAVEANAILGNTLPAIGPGTSEKALVAGLLGGGGALASDVFIGNDPVGAGSFLGGTAAAYGLAAMSPASARALARVEALRGPTRSAAARLAQEQEDERRRRLEASRGY